jgi:electron transfer flavoprotein alpha subunit
LSDKPRDKNSVCVCIESQHGEVAQVSLELICRAREMAEKLGVSVTAVAIGTGLKKFSPLIFSYGCDTYFPVEDKRLDSYETIPYSRALAAVFRKIQPQIALFGATPIGRDIAPRVAGILKVGLTADCTDLAIGDYEDPKTKKTTATFCTRSVRPSAATSSPPSCRPSTGPRWPPCAKVS